MVTEDKLGRTQHAESRHPFGHQAIQVSFSSICKVPLHEVDPQQNFKTWVFPGVSQQGGSYTPTFLQAGASAPNFDGGWRQKVGSLGWRFALGGSGF